MQQHWIILQPKALIRFFGKKLVLVVSIFPLIWVANLMIFAIRAKYYLGHWPKPYHPDPKVLPFVIHAGLLWLGVPAVLSTLIIMPFFLLLSFKKNSFSVPLKLLILFALGWFFIFLMTFIPPIDFVTWFLD